MYSLRRLMRSLSLRTQIGLYHWGPKEEPISDKSKEDPTTEKPKENIITEDLKEDLITENSREKSIIENVKVSTITKKLFLIFWSWYMIKWVMEINFLLSALILEGFIFTLHSLKYCCKRLFLVMPYNSQRPW